MSATSARLGGALHEPEEPAAEPERGETADDPEHRMMADRLGDRDEHGEDRRDDRQPLRERPRLLAVRDAVADARRLLDRPALELVGREEGEPRQRRRD